LTGSTAEMDNVMPENLAYLQKIARDYVTSPEAHLKEICAVLKTGRGSDMPGIGRKPS
jgi:hypothetical protein